MERDLVHGRTMDGLAAAMPSTAQPWRSAPPCWSNAPRAATRCSAPCTRHAHHAGWASLASVGHIITKQRPGFDSRNYGYAKLNELIAATTLFVLDRRSPGEGKAAIMYVRDKRHQDKKPGA